MTGVSQKDTFIMFPVKTDVSLSTGRQMAKKCKKKGKKIKLQVETQGNLYEFKCKCDRGG